MIDLFVDARKNVDAAALEAFEPLLKRGYWRYLHTGQYPRFSVRRDGDSSVSVDLMMCLREDGSRQREFSMASPFELGGSAALDLREGPVRVRCWRPYIAYERRPFDQVLRTLKADVLEIADLVESWPRDSILALGRRHKFQDTQ